MCAAASPCWRQARAKAMAAVKEGSLYIWKGTSACLPACLPVDSLLLLPQPLAPAPAHAAPRGPWCSSQTFLLGRTRGWVNGPGGPDPGCGPYFGGPCCKSKPTQSRLTCTRSGKYSNNAQLVLLIANILRVGRIGVRSLQPWLADCQLSSSSAILDCNHTGK